MVGTLKQLLDAYQALPLARKVGIAAVGTAALGLAGWLALGDLDGRYRTIAKDLTDAASASNLVERLKQSGIEARLADSGRAVEVPDSKVPAAVRIATAALPKRQAPMISEIVRKQSMYLSGDERHLLNLRVLEERLEEILETYEPVERAAVNLSVPREDLFAQERNGATAAIILTLRAGFKPCRELLRTIRAAASHGIEGLKPEDISISDSHGTNLDHAVDGAGGPSEEPADAEEALAVLEQHEHDLAAKVTKILTPLFGEENLSITVTVEDREDGNRPQSGRAAASPAQLVSMGHILEPTPPLAPSTPPALARRPRGESRGRICASVLINSNAFSKGTLPEGLRKTAEELVRSAVGFDSSREDVVHVVGAPFRQSLPAKPAGQAAVGDLLTPYAGWIWGGGTTGLLLMLAATLRLGFPSPSRRFETPGPSDRGQPLQGCSLDLSEAELRTVLQENGKRDLALVLAAAPQPLRVRFLSRVPLEDREVLSAQIGVLDGTSIHEVKLARARILKILNRPGADPEPVAGRTQDNPL